jgi:hypothetical protein
MPSFATSYCIDLRPSAAASECGCEAAVPTREFERVEREDADIRACEKEYAAKVSFSRPYSQAAEDCGARI